MRHPHLDQPDMPDVPEHVTEDGCDNELDYTHTHTPDKVTAHMDHQVRCGCIPVNRQETGPTETKNRHRILQTPPTNPIGARPTTSRSLAHIYRVSQEECARLRESVPCVKVYRYNPKDLYPKLNAYGDNGQRSLKL